MSQRALRQPTPAGCLTRLPELADSQQAGWMRVMKPGGEKADELRIAQLARQATASGRKLTQRQPEIMRPNGGCQLAKCKGFGA
jgi:hypothetical protein